MPLRQEQAPATRSFRLCNCRSERSTVPYPGCPRVRETTPSSSPGKIAAAQSTLLANICCSKATSSEPSRFASKKLQKRKNQGTSMWGPQATRMVGRCTRLMRNDSALLTPGQGRAPSRGRRPPPLGECPGRVWRQQHLLVQPSSAQWVAILTNATSPGFNSCIPRQEAFEEATSGRAWPFHRC